jgi:hypothetical protein
MNQEDELMETLDTNCDDSEDDSMQSWGMTATKLEDKGDDGDIIEASDQCEDFFKPESEGESTSCHASNQAIMSGDNAEQENSHGGAIVDAVKTFHGDLDDKEEVNVKNDVSPVKMESAASGDLFSCDKCDYQARTTVGLYNHNKKHTRDGGYDCPDCGEMFTRAKDVMDHGVQEHGGLRCSDCDKRFRLRANYNQHIKVVHRKERYPCKVCGKDFASKQGLTTHMNMHMGLRPFQCDQCESAFAGLDLLCKHKRLHCKGGVMEATCPICGKGLPK